MQTTSNADSLSGHEPPSPEISLAVAQARIRKWGDEVQPLFPNKEDIPRAILIKHEDLDGIRKNFPEASGIRVYFGLEEIDGVLRLTGSVVPVEEAAGEYSDVVLSDGEKSSIYDFTSPCPIYCGKPSVLHVPLTNVSGS